MTAVSFRVPGDPRGKGAGRAGIAGGRAMVFTDSKTRVYQNLVKLAAEAAMAGRPPIEHPVALTMVVKIRPPDSVSKKKRAAMLDGTIRPGKKPDLSNYIKALEDGCNNVVFVDDALVVTLNAAKWYDESPGMDVLVRIA